MPYSLGLETCALLAKHLRTYTPLISIIGSSKSKDVRQRAFSELAEAVLSSEEIKADVYKIISNLIGEDVKDFNLPDILNKIRNGWRDNNMTRYFYVLKSLGVIDDKDIANLAWIQTNYNRRE